MSRMSPIKRRELIVRLRRAGFTGPHVGAKHQAMRRGPFTLPIPNPHQEDIGIHLLKKILQEAGISRGEWERLSR